MFDLLLRNATVIDGTRKPRYRADVGVQGDRIAAVGKLEGAQAGRVVDAGGHVLAPGFIDVHTHSDGWLLKQSHFWQKTSQGFTTELLMADGISYAPVNDHTWREWFFYLRSLNGLRMDDYLGWQSLADYMALLDGRNVQNFATHVPFANVRSLACGFRQQRADDYQLRTMRREIRKSMEAGACGLSTGMDYLAQPFVTTDEIVNACTAIAPYNGLYVTHVRYKHGLMPALREAIDIGRRAGVRVHISHLKASGPEEVERVIHWIDTEARHQVDLTFDVYPYQRGCTMLNSLLPCEAWDDGPFGVIAHMSKSEALEHFRIGLESMELSLDRFHIAWTATSANAVHHGKSVAEFVAETGRSPEEALYHLLVEENLAVLMVIGAGEDPLVYPFLQHDLYMMGSDGIYFPESRNHPRVYGSAPRLLGPCVRDLKLFSLEDAVHKLSYRAARRFGLKDRGEIREGAFADLVVFNSETVTDLATYENPHQISRGIEHVVVNGQVIVENATPVDLQSDCLPGRYLRYEIA